MSIKIRYKDVAVGADKDASLTTSAHTSFSNVQSVPYGVESPTLATCELNGWGLTPETRVLDAEKVGFWSNALSHTDCIFYNVPQIIIEFTQQYTATGLSIQFDINGGDYCKKIGVAWYREGSIIENITYYPESPFFVLNKTVVAFDKIRIQFYETHLPRKRCKVDYIGIGVVRDFSTKEIKSAKSIHEVDLISSTVPINVHDASIHSNEEVDYIFQKKQPVEVYDNNSLIGVYYIDKGERTGRLDFSFSCKDKIGLLDLVQYNGGLWLTDTPLTTVLTDIFGDISIFEIDSAYASSFLRGFIPAMKQREALQHIAFVLGAVVDTSGSDKIKIFPSPVMNVTEEISATQTYTGGKIVTSDTVTAVEITAFEIVDERPGDKQSSIEFEGVKYLCMSYVYTDKNPVTVTSDPENIKKFDKCYLVNTSNAQSLVAKVMNYYRLREKYSFKHVMDGQEVAKPYKVTLPWDGTANGVITKMTVTTSNITVSDTEMLLNG